MKLCLEKMKLCSTEKVSSESHNNNMVEMTWFGEALQPHDPNGSQTLKEQ